MKHLAAIAVFAASYAVATPQLYTVSIGGSSSQISASVYSKNESAISTRISGYVKKIYVEEGDTVKKGAPLFEIDAAGANAAVTAANADYMSAKATAADAKRDYERYKILLDKGVVSGKEYERAKLNYDVKSASAKSAAAYLQKSRNDESYALVRAPVSGTILKKYATVASTVMPGQPVLLLSGNGDLRIKAEIFEREAIAFHVGENVAFTVNGLTRIAKIISITPSGSGARSFLLRAVPKEQAGLYSGMFVKIAAKTGVSSLRIPLSCVTKRGGISGVFEYKNAHAFFRPIRIKGYDGGFVAADGISSGIRVIQNPKESLQDGMRAE